MAELNNHTERAHALLSASSAARWLACPPSAVAASLYRDETTAYEAEGTLAHEVAEAVASGKMLAETDAGDSLSGGITPEMVKCAFAYRDCIAEHTTADSVVMLERRVDFSPWVPDGFGTADCIILSDDTLTVIDYKYGKGVPVSAVGNPQMRLYALGAYNDYGVAYDSIRSVRMIIFQPRLDRISDDEIPLAELLKWATKTVKPIAARAAVGKGKYAPGENCRFCPHAGKCRALARHCTQYLTASGSRVGVTSLEPWEVADILAQKDLITTWLRRVESQALTDLTGGGDIPGWKVVSGKLGDREWTDEGAVREALLAAGFPESRITRTSLLSPAQLERAVGKKAAPIVETLITRKPGRPVLAPDSDPRPIYDRKAELLNTFD